MYPGIRFTGRLVDNPLHQMNRGESFLADGSGSQTVYLTRWGDSSSMCVDPVGGYTFYFINEYYTATGRLLGQLFGLIATY